MAKKRAMTQREKDNAWLKEKLENLLAMVCLVFGVIGAGYMFFTGESLGWIVAGFVGGFMIPIVPVALVQALLEISHSDPAFDAVNDRYIRETAHSKWRMDHT